MDVPSPRHILRSLKSALLEAEREKSKAIHALGDVLETTCTVLCMADESYARHIPVQDYVSVASELLSYLMLYSHITGGSPFTKGGSSRRKAKSGPHPTTGSAEAPLFSELPSRLPVLALRYAALIGQVSPTGCVALANPKHGLLPALMTLLGNALFLLDKPEAAEELLRCVQLITPHAHAELLEANAPVTLASLEPVLSNPTLQKLCLECLEGLYARAHWSEWPLLKASAATLLDNLGHWVDYHFPSSLATASSHGLPSSTHSRGPSSTALTTQSRRASITGVRPDPLAPGDSAAYRLTREDRDMLLGYITCISQLCDRVLTTPEMIKGAFATVETIVRVLTRLFQSAVALGWDATLSAGSATGESRDPFENAAQQLRFVALGPLLSLYYTAPATVAGVLIAGRVLGAVSSAAAHVLDQSSRAVTAAAAAGEPLAPAAAEPPGGDPGVGGVLLPHVEGLPAASAVGPVANVLLRSTDHPSAGVARRRSAQPSPAARVGELGGDEEDGAGSLDDLVRGSLTGLDLADTMGEDDAGPVAAAVDGAAGGAPVEGSPAADGESRGEVAFLADERAVVPVMEFLLAVLPPAPVGDSTDDHLGLVLPLHFWSWADDFRNRTACGERVSRFMDRAYSGFRRKCLAAPSLNGLPLKDQVLVVSLHARRKIFIHLERQEFVCGGGMAPHAMTRSPLFAGYTHVRQEGLTGRGIYGACRCLALTERERARELDERGDASGAGGGSSVSPISPRRSKKEKRRPAPVEELREGQGKGSGAPTATGAGPSPTPDPTAAAAGDSLDVHETDGGSERCRDANGRGRSGGAAAEQPLVRPSSDEPPQLTATDTTATAPRPPSRSGSGARRGSTSVTGWTTQLFGTTRGHVASLASLDHAEAILRGATTITSSGGGSGRASRAERRRLSRTSADESGLVWQTEEDSLAAALSPAYQRLSQSPRPRPRGGGGFFSCCFGGGAGGGEGGVVASGRRGSSSSGRAVGESVGSTPSVRPAPATYVPPRPLRELFSDARVDAVCAASTYTAFVSYEAVQALLSGVVPAIVGVVRCAVQPLIARHGALVLLRALSLTAAFCCESRGGAGGRGGGPDAREASESDGCRPWRLVSGHRTETKRVAEMLRAVVPQLLPALTYLLTTDEGAEMSEAGLASTRSVFATVKDEGEYRDAVSAAGLDPRYTCYGLSIKAERRVAAADALCILLHLHQLLGPLVSGSGSGGRSTRLSFRGVGSTSASHPSASLDPGAPTKTATTTRDSVGLIPEPLLRQQRRIMMRACVQRVDAVHAMIAAAAARPAPSEDAATTDAGTPPLGPGKLRRSASALPPCPYHPTYELLITTYVDAHMRLIRLLLLQAAPATPSGFMSRLGQVFHLRRSAPGGGGGAAAAGALPSPTSTSSLASAKGPVKSREGRRGRSKGAASTTTTTTSAMAPLQAGAEDHMASPNPLLAPQAQARQGEEAGAELPQRPPPLQVGALKDTEGPGAAPVPAPASSVEGVGRPLAAEGSAGVEGGGGGAATATTPSPQARPSTSVAAALACALRERIPVFRHVQPAALRAALALDAYMRETHTDIRTLIAEAPEVLREVADTVGAWVTTRRMVLDYAEVMPDNTLEMLAVKGPVGEAEAVAAPDTLARASVDGLTDEVRKANALIHALKDAPLDSATTHCISGLVAELMGAVVESLGLSEARPPVRLAVHLPSNHWQTATTERTWQSLSAIMGMGLHVRLRPCTAGLSGDGGAPAKTDTAAAGVDAGAASGGAEASRAGGEHMDAAARDGEAGAASLPCSSAAGASDPVASTNVPASGGDCQLPRASASVPAGPVPPSSPIRALSRHVSVNTETREITIYGQTHRFWHMVSLDDSSTGDDVIVLPFSTVGTMERQIGQSLVAMTVEDGELGSGVVPMVVDELRHSERIYSPLLHAAVERETACLSRATVLTQEYQSGFETPEHLAPVPARDPRAPLTVALLAGAVSATAAYEAERGAAVSEPPASPPAPAPAPTPAFSSAEVSPRWARGLSSGTARRPSTSQRARPPLSSLRSSSRGAPAPPARASPLPETLTPGGGSAPARDRGRRSSARGPRRSKSRTPSWCYPRLDHHVLLLINGVPLLNPQVRLIDALLAYAPSAEYLAYLLPRLVCAPPLGEEDPDDAIWDILLPSSLLSRRYRRESGRGGSGWAAEVARVLRTLPFWRERHDVQVVVLESPVARQSLRTYALCACELNVQSTLVPRLSRRSAPSHPAGKSPSPTTRASQAGGGRPAPSRPSCPRGPTRKVPCGLADGGFSFPGEGTLSRVPETPCGVFHCFELIHARRVEPLDAALKLLSHLLCVLRAEGVEVPSMQGDQRRMGASLVQNLSSLTPAVTFKLLGHIVAPRVMALTSVRGYLATFAFTCYPFVFPFEMRSYALRFLAARRPTPAQAMLREAVRGVGFRGRPSLTVLWTAVQMGAMLPRGDAHSLLASIMPPGEEVRLLSMSWPVNPLYSLKVNRHRVLTEGSALLRRMTDWPAALGFHLDGEQGIGLGPTLEFYELLAEAIASVQPPIWRTVEVAGPASTGAEPARETAPLLYPSPTHAAVDAAYHYETLGMLVGLLVVTGRTTSVRFHPLFLSALAGRCVLAESMKGGRDTLALLDPALEASLRRLESMPPEVLEASELESVLPAPELPPDQPVFLSPNGVPELLTHTNVHYYTRAVRTYYLKTLLSDCVVSFRVGLSCYLDPYLLRLFSAEELSVLFSGRTGKIWSSSAAMARDVVAAHGYTMRSRVVQDLITLVPQWDAVEQRRFLRFVTGASSLPIRGLPFPIKVVCRNVAGVGGGEVSMSPPVETPAARQGATVYQAEVDATLPTVSTCFHYLKLPEYSSQRVLEMRLRYAMLESSGTYGLT